jgi:hypothetical protein
VLKISASVFNLDHPFSIATTVALLSSLYSINNREIKPFEVNDSQKLKKLN